ncbi:hypothetical protein [Paenibacillus sp. FSL R5-808]|jgi:hypothetical protein|uniref:hypothetical protein n=1 Tax=Paenibacillus sp. FSL R5-808 TaxID=1227076 RepID=UPI0003E20FF7|nr:hypothetical protein [Paenibacillus sp. FSL R5-808]ETT33292.1 hypothetical protein C169_22890 [Paenibacillus sp. FSL R5-808]
MKLKRLNTQDHFDQLKKGQLVIVKWKPGSYEYKKGHEIGHYNMYEINRNNEIILRKRDNIYFIIEMYLNRESNASDAYVLQAGYE